MLSKLDLSGNDMGGLPNSPLWEAMTSLGAALKASATVTDLNISENDLEAPDIAGFAGHLKDMGQLSKLTWSGGNYDHGRQQAPPVTLDTTMTEADLSNKHLGESGATILAAFITTKNMQDKGSLSKLKMEKYELPVQEIKTATELDLSNKGLGKLDAIVIVVLIKVRKLQNRFVTN